MVGTTAPKSPTKFSAGKGEGSNAYSCIDMINKIEYSSYRALAV